MMQVTFDQPLVISWTTDASGGCTHIDPLWRAFTGQDDTQAQGFGWLEAVHPEDRERTRADFSTAIETRSPYRREYRLRRANGDYRWTLAAGAPRFEADGDFVGYVGSVVDIDEKHAAEARLAESEELHRKLLGALADGVFVAQDHCFVFSNPTLPALLGFRREDFEGLPFEAVIAPEDLNVWMARYEARIGEGPEPPQHYGLRVLRRDGDALDMELSARRIRYKGRPAVLGVLRDVTQRHRAEEALRQSERRFRSLVTATSEVVYGMSPDWSKLLYLWGRSFLPDVSEPKSDWLDTYILPEDRPLITQAVAEAVRNRRVFEVEHRLRLADGSIRWVFSRAIPHLDANGEIGEWFGAVSDVTDRKNAEEALKEAHRLKDEFLATLAHELRNPLAPIRNGVTLLASGPLEPEKSRMVLEMMERQVKHLIRLVDDLLEIARISQGKIALRKEATNLSSVLRASLETAQPLIEKGRHQVTMRAPGQLGVMGDPIRLGQAFTNLITNAAKFTPPGGRIEIIGETEGNHAIVRVRDNGCGISPAALPRVFDMFAQVEDKARHAQGGLGIGLALVRKLIDMHGGTVQAQSDGPDKGSEFTVRLPLQETISTAGATAQPAPALAAVPPAAVVIDDNHDAADALAMLLESFGARVSVAYDGETGAQLVQAARPGIVFLDLGMPKQDGFETARIIRDTEIGRKLTLVALTGWGQEEDRNRTRQAGFDAHLTKPAPLDALQALLLACAVKGKESSDGAAALPQETRQQTP